MSNTKVPNPVPNNPSTRIITLLESNDVSNLKQAGKWSNTLNENTIIEEGDQIVVRQAYVDTTTTGGNLIDVSVDEAEIIIQHGMYVTDAGDGKLDNVSLSSPVGDGQQSQTHTTYSDAKVNHPNAKNYILQNQTTGNNTVRLFYNAGASGIEENFNPGTTSFTIDMIPSTDPNDKFEYTIETGDAAYVAPTGPFPFPATTTTGPILVGQNLKGLRAILVHETEPTVDIVFKVYSNGFTPVGSIDKDKDHIATFQQLFDPVKKSPTGAPIPIGYQTTPNPNVDRTRFDPSAYWVYRNALDKPGGTATSYQYWSNTDGGKVHRVLRLLNAFRMIVDNYRDVSKGAQAPYQTQFTYTNQIGARQTKLINYSDWGKADYATYGNTISYQGLFAQNEVYGPNYNLADLSTAKGRNKVGFGGLGKATDNQQVHWVEFRQLQDRITRDNIVLEPFAFDLAEGIEAFSYVDPDKVKGKTRGAWVPGYALGIYNPFSDAAGTVKSVALLSAGQMDHSAVPSPPPGGAMLIPRIYTTKFTIPAVSYTYQALAQILTDRMNEVTSTIEGLSNDPFPADGSAPPALNPRGFSNSRFLTTTYELGMQQKTDPESAIKLADFPSDVTWVTGTDTQIQPVWVSEDGLSGLQYAASVIDGATAPRWCGAEAVSFIYDESSDSFQVAQSHSNIYSRLDGGIIARQFRTVLQSPVTGNLVTADKAGGIFFTSLEPKSLFFDKMKFQQHNILVEQLTNNPSLQNFKSGISQFEETPQNNLLENALTHTCNLRPARNITGNFLGLGTYIDKRVRVTQEATTPGDPPTVSFKGGKYGEVDVDYTLDVGVATPITITGQEINESTVEDPYFAIEISGLVNQDIVGPAIKNNMIQSIIGKYFSDGSFTSGSIDDSFRYTHIGMPMMLRSLSVRILDSEGLEVEGLGPNSAVILEIDKG